MTDIDDLPEKCLHGNCFQLAYKFFDQNFTKGNYRLVHGMVSGQAELSNYRYIHAWIEDLDTDQVIDLTQSDAFQILPKDIYYLLGNIDSKELHTYDMLDVYHEVQLNPTYGPWDQVFIDKPYYKL